MTKTSLIEFPCYFPIKVMGVNSPDFLDEITKITSNHFPDITHDAITHKPSSGANYLAITVTVFAQNQETLDAYYLEITQHPLVKMVL